MKFTQQRRPTASKIRCSPDVAPARPPWGSVSNAVLRLINSVFGSSVTPVPGQRLAKGLAPATRFHAEEPSCTEADHDRHAIPRQDGRASEAPAINPSRRSPIRGARA